MTEDKTVAPVPWLLLMFRLSAKQASPRVEVWRKLRTYGALSLKTSGHLLPYSAENQERFEWLAAAIRKYRGNASVAQVRGIDDLPNETLVQLFVETRSREYEALIREVKKLGDRSELQPSALARLRRRLHQIAAIDFFNSPLRGRAEALLADVEAGGQSKTLAGRSSSRRKEYSGRVWVTRHRPGIDRVSSAWLIRRFIDPNARFVFADDPNEHEGAVPFDMFQAGGFGHRGNQCTFETLRKDFGIRDAKTEAIAEIIHDADLADEKFGRAEAIGLDRVLIGWAKQGVSDDELLRRGMEIIEGLYRGV